MSSDGERSPPRGRRDDRDDRAAGRGRSASDDDDRRGDRKDRGRDRSRSPVRRDNNEGGGYGSYNDQPRYGGSGGGGGGGREWRAGDWECDKCKSHNFASREACYRCREPRSSGSAAAQYNSNYPQYGGGSSYGGGGYNGSGYGGGGGGYSGGGYGGGGGGYGGGGGGGYGGGGGGYGSGGKEWKPGDWNCPSCQAHNFASRMECFRCREPKAEGAN